MPRNTSITYSQQLEMLPNNKIIVPGCEPASSFSSKALGAYMARGGCGNALVDVALALEAIPGSFVKIGRNWGKGQLLQKWYVLPPVDVDCPCDDYDDFYSILRGLATEDLPEEETYDKCNIIGMGYCPSPMLDQDIPEPPPSPYEPETSFPPGTGVLPPIPPWA